MSNVDRRLLAQGLSMSLCLLLAASPRPTRAQEDAAAAEPLVSGDNPGFTNVTSPAPQYTLVTEQLVNTSFPAQGVQIAAPALLARFGLLDWLEVRASLPSVVVNVPDMGDTQVGSDQLSIGAVLTADFSPTVSGSLVPEMVVPIADDGIGPPEVQGNLQANLSWAISERWSLAAAVRGGWVHVPVSLTQVRAEPLLRAGALGQFNPIPEFAMFVQSYADYVGSLDVEPVVGGGIAYWIVPPVSLFAEANSGISANSPPVQATLGAAVRWW